MTAPETIVIPTSDLAERVLHMKAENYRLIQICAVALPGATEVTYSFGNAYKMVNLRLIVQGDEEIVSISDIYSPAFLYENEIRDLFGANIQLIDLDYKGNLYRIEQKAPYRKPAEEKGE